jgi:hypothetical protein
MSSRMHEFRASALAHRGVRLAILTAALALPLGAGPYSETSVAPAPMQSAGEWIAIGSMRLTKAGCAARPCAMIFQPSRRHGAFALATDTPYPMILTGSFTTTCIAATPVVIPLGSPTGRGVFQTVPNPCATRYVKTLAVDVASVTLAPQDDATGAVLTLFGSSD